MFDDLRALSISCTLKPPPSLCTPKTNLLGAVVEGAITASARPLHVGGSTIVVETEVRRADVRSVGKATPTQAVLKGR